MKLRSKIGLSVLLSLMVLCAHAQWVRQAKSRAFSRSNGVASDQFGNVYSVGVFVCITSFDAETLLNNSCGEITPPAPTSVQTDAFLAKHDPDGNLIWVRQFTGSAGNKLFANDVAVDPSGNAYVTGSFTGTLNLLAATFHNPDATTEYFIVKIGSDGTPAWAHSDAADDLSETTSQKIAVTQDALYITGSVRGDFQVGALIDSVGREASFVASFDHAGAHQWTRHFMEINENGFSRGKALDAKGDSIFVFSSFRDTVDIEGNIVRPRGPAGSATAGIICLYDASGALLNRILTNTPLIESIKLHRPDDRLYIAGRAENTIGIGQDTLFNGAGIRAFISSHDVDDDATLLWVTSLTASNTGSLTILDIDVSQPGDIFATGIFQGASINGPTTSAPGGGGQNGFVVRLDNAGNDEWIQSLGGAGEDATPAISARLNNEVYAAGYFSRYIRVAGDELNSEATSNGFVARIDNCPELVADMLTADTTFVCDRSTVLFQVSNNASYTYEWFHDGIPVPSAADADLDVGAAGLYRARITGLGCTKLTPFARLLVNPLPDSVVVTNDPLENCEGDIVKLVGPLGSYTFSWLDNGVPIGEVTKDLAVQTDGDYRLEVQDALGCTILSDTFKVRFLPYPSNILSPPGGRYTLCSGNGLLLEADNSQTGMTWQWRRDDLAIADADDYQYEATTSGIYQAVVRNAVGCETITEADTVVVQASPLVNLNNEDLPAEICDGTSLRLVTPQVIGQSYQWFRNSTLIPGAISNTLDVSTPGDYTVRVNNALCEKFSDVFDLVVRPLPVAQIINNAQTAICQGDGYALLAEEDPDSSYDWLDNSGPIAGENDPALTVVKTGNYRLRVTNQFDCENTSPATTVVVNLKPPANITPGSELTFCEGGQVNLSANAGTLLSYEWIRNGVPQTTLTQRTIAVNQSAEFQVRVTNSNLCSEVSAPVVVDVIPYPVSTIGSASGITTICERDSVPLTSLSNALYTYTWLRNALPVPGEGTNTLYAKQAGAYQVIVSAGACRDTSDVLTLSVRSNPLPIITRNEAFLSIALFGDIQWYRNDEPLPEANLQAIHIMQDGNYTVNVINAEGCSAWSDVMSVCLPLPSIEKRNDMLAVSIDAKEYRWEYKQIPIGGGDQRQLLAQQSGEYSVVVVSHDNCVMETEPVTVCIPYPSIERDEFTGVLYAFPNPATAYQWYFDGKAIADGKTQVHIPDNPGIYNVLVTDLEGCASFAESFTVSPVTGLERARLALDFYPNPVKDHLTVQTPTNELISLIIVDALGREVLNVDIHHTDQQIDLGAFANGIYTILARSSTRTQTQKLVIRH